MNKRREAELMLARSLESSRVPLYMSTNNSILGLSELEKLAEGIAPSQAPSMNISKIPVPRRKSTVMKRPSVLALKLPTTVVTHIAKTWGGSKTQPFQLAVVQGSVFIPNKFKPEPIANSFENTRDLGSPGATRRWVLHLEDFRDNEISFQLHRNKLTARGYQITRKDSPKKFNQSIELPNPFCIDCLKVYRNKRVGAVIIALIPDNFPFFKS